MKKNRLNINYWLRKIFVTKIFQKLIKDKSTLRKTVFTSIFKSKHWAHGDIPDEYISVSGHGSNINTEQSSNLISSLVEFIKKNKINSILDMPCGDFLWMNKLLKQTEIRNYLGLDIVEEIIDQNIKLYENENIRFRSCDIVDYETSEEFDLVLMRDFFIHTNNEDIRRILMNIKKMNIKYFAFENYSIFKNVDVISGKHRKINLKLNPFNLMEPFYSFKDFEIDKFIYVYKKEALDNLL
tara:strand:+ start:101 stop:820 length:720 start_codon:yes stop_codon:yes gene_type:complete